MLALDQVSKAFGRVRVADQLSLAVGDGEAVGIVGPNGAGKSSLFSIISGDLTPDAGDVMLGGQRVTRLGPAARCRLGIGRTYQVPRPFEHMSVYENVLVAAEQGGRSSERSALGAVAIDAVAGAARVASGGRLRKAEARDRAMAVLAETGLQAVANHAAGRLTLLDRKRLELARALATEPRLLLLDEVAGGLSDPEVDELVAIVTARRSTGVTIVWVEHVVHALTRTVDRLLCLAGGAFIADGAPDEVLASPAVREVYLGVEPELAVQVAPDGAGATDPEVAP
ncbi:MAG TPA: ABC transporter ATP-binding protein [Micromonosporaceae bacterium]|nr:ABC transporter ATP-binding protein [Micromonosporaceae bacterium]